MHEVRLRLDSSMPALWPNRAAGIHLLPVLRESVGEADGVKATRSDVPAKRGPSTPVAKRVPPPLNRHCTAIAQLADDFFELQRVGTDRNGRRLYQCELLMSVANAVNHGDSAQYRNHPKHWAHSVEQGS